MHDDIKSYKTNISNSNFETKRVDNFEEEEKANKETN